MIERFFVWFYTIPVVMVLFLLSLFTGIETYDKIGGMMYRSARDGYVDEDEYKTLMSELDAEDEE